MFTLTTPSWLLTVQYLEKLTVNGGGISWQLAVCKTRCRSDVLLAASKGSEVSDNDSHALKSICGHLADKESASCSTTSILNGLYHGWVHYNSEVLLYSCNCMVLNKGHVLHVLCQTHTLAAEHWRMHFSIEVDMLQCFQF